jgi:hypothetical protein
MMMMMVMMMMMMIIIIIIIVIANLAFLSLRHLLVPHTLLFHKLNSYGSLMLKSVGCAVT